MFRNRKGQSTVEYILVATAVIAVIIAVSKGSFTTKLNNTLEQAAGSIGDKADKLDLSRTDADHFTRTTGNYGFNPAENFAQ